MNGLVQIEKEKYLEKLVKVNSDCPYILAEQTWQTTFKMLETFLPKINSETLYIYMISRRNFKSLITIIKITHVLLTSKH